MIELTKEQLTLILNEINGKLAVSTEKDYKDYAWYGRLIWKDDLEEYFEQRNKGIKTIEDRLAVNAVKYP